MSTLLTSMALSAALTAQPHETPDGDTAVLEVGLSTSLQQSNAAASNLAYASYRRTGLGAGISMALRSRYLLVPTLELSRVSLVEGSRAMGSSGTVQTQLYTWAYRAGVAADLGRFRPALGIGLYDLNVRARAQGQTYASRELDFGYHACLTVFPYIRGPLRIGVEIKGDLLAEAAVNSVGLGVRLSYDALHF